MVVIFSSSLLLVVLLLVAGPGSAEENATTTEEPLAEPTWICDDVSVQSNLTMQQVLGEWFLLELDDGSSTSLEDVCLKISLTDDGNNRSSLNLAAFRDRSDGSRKHKLNYSGDRPGELVAGDLRSVWRVHSLSADGRVLVMAMCNIRGNLFWMTLGVGEDSLPANHPQRSSFSARRDANVCQQLADSNAK